MTTMITESLNNAAAQRLISTEDTARGAGTEHATMGTFYVCQEGNVRMSKGSKGCRLVSVLSTGDQGEHG